MFFHSTKSNLPILSIDTTIETPTAHTYWLTTLTPRLKSRLTMIARPQFFFHYQQNEPRQQFYEFKGIPRTQTLSDSSHFLNWLKMHVFSYYWRLRNDALVHVQINVLVGPFVLNTREGVTTAFSTWSRMERATKIIKWTTRLKHREKPYFEGGFDSLNRLGRCEKTKIEWFLGSNRNHWT